MKPKRLLILFVAVCLCLLTGMAGSKAYIAVNLTGDKSTRLAEYNKAVYLKRNATIYKTNSKKEKQETGLKSQLYYAAGITIGSYTPVMNVVTKRTGFIKTKDITTTKPTTDIVTKKKAQYDYETMEKNLKQLAATYPQWMSVKSLGQTIDHRELYCAVIGNRKAKKQMVVTASIHAREYLNTMLVMEQMEQYLNNYQKKSSKIGMTYEKLFQKVCLYIVPMVNPDGVTISQYGPNGLHSKKLQKSVKKLLKGTSYKRWKANAAGVDLNRNYPFKWSVNCSVKKPGSTSYPGAYAGSEKETKAIIKLFESLSNPVGSIAYHSTGNIADWNRNANSRYYVVNQQMGETTKHLTGYRYPTYNLTGGEGGSMGMWLSNGKWELPNITIETGNTSCPLPYSYYNRLWKDNRYVIESLTKLVY